MQTIKVSAKTYTARLAGSIAGAVRSGEQTVLRAEGVQAVDKAVSAMLPANSLMANDGLQGACVPKYARVRDGDRELTVVQFVLEVRPAPAEEGGAGRSASGRATQSGIKFGNRLAISCATLVAVQ